MSKVDDENVSVEDTESISINGETSIIINEDYILNTPELREMAINNIFNRINGLTYYDTKLITYYGKPFLSIGAKIRIMINDNDYVDTYNLKHYFEYDGTFNSTIESPSLTKEAIKVKQNANSLAEKLYSTAINIDKQNQNITLAVEELVIDLNEEKQVIDDLNNAITTIQSTILEQTSRAFTMWFEETGLQDTIDNINNGLNSNQTDLNTIKEYIQFEGAKITLGKSTSPYKVTIQNDEIAFWAGNTKCAYISQNKLFIDQIVVVNQFQRGYFLDEIDEDGYLDLYWVGD